MIKFKRYNKLNEELGISKEVQQECVKLINKINKLLSEKKSYTVYHLNDRSEPNVYGINTVEYPLLFDELPIHLILQIYFCSNNEYNKLSKAVKRPMVYNFNDTTDVMIIRFPIIRDGGFDFNHDDVQITKQDDFIYEKLSHELKHAYQKAMIFKNTERENIMHQNDMAVYDKAHKYIQSTKLTNDTVSQIIFSVYYLFTQEITANIEGLYTRIWRNTDNLKDALSYLMDSQLFNTIEQMENILYDIKYNGVDDKTKNDIQIILNKNIKWVIYHMEKGINFAYKKFRQLEKLLKKTYTK